MRPSKLAQAVPISALLCMMTIAALIGIPGVANADELSGGALVTALRHGGYVLLMRHTSSPNSRPDKSAADPENVNQERQLDQVGRDTARHMGEAIKTLGIPIGDVLSSPTYRALQVVRLESLGQAQTFPELGEDGGNMGPVHDAAASWLRKKVSERPRSGTNTLIVTHLPNIRGAFGAAANMLADGETLVYQPDEKGFVELVAHIKIEDWPGLAAR
jgi:phosphohistidine phosphatase SixA